MHDAVMPSLSLIDNRLRIHFEYSDWLFKEQPDTSTLVHLEFTYIGDKFDKLRLCG